MLRSNQQLHSFSIEIIKIFLKNHGFPTKTRKLLGQQVNMETDDD